MTLEPGTYVGEYHWDGERLLRWDGTSWTVPIPGAGPDQQPAVDDYTSPSEG
ncbi:hypothetical protein [Cellulosimicrobium arenosum]|uniref:Uncharacterized protein n=1 Tax=Cellulosimicrobium arenosum TaxID=2708133 RepID=A0A927G8Q0_9MICO|nr:hypothetical protein [Cellulosimicrobium arenosum]MBD8078974.1 hypothetical protein [Cellulosimicrobium arenosum]